MVFENRLFKTTFSSDVLISFYFEHSPSFILKSKCIRFHVNQTKMKYVVKRVHVEIVNVYTNFCLIDLSYTLPGVDS